MELTVVATVGVRGQERGLDLVVGWAAPEPWSRAVEAGQHTTTMPEQSISAASHSRVEKERRRMTIEPSITGSSFADLSTVCVGMSM